MFDTELNFLAAEYVRVSTERQEYSIANQRSFIASYAEANGYKICRTYCDAARSGLDLKRRPALRQLLAEIIERTSNFKVILVYDVSRWGRFQDPDEAAHYEYLCKAAGISVHYCAERFPNDKNPCNVIFKTLKRVMAAEYSRELSDKVFAGLVRLVKNGYRTGAFPGYGLQRMLVGPDRKPKQLLKEGEHKSLTTDRVIFVLGPPDEVTCVREIYRMFVHERRSFSEIAQVLNESDVPFARGKKWADFNVKKVLTHPKYKGTAVYNRTSERLCSQSRPVPRSEWIEVPGAFEGIVTSEMFEKAQQTWRAKVWNRSNEEVLDSLRKLWKKHGYLSSALIAKQRVSPVSGALCRRFGSLRKAYELIGYKTPYGRTATNRLDVYRLRYQLMNDLIQALPEEISIYFPGGGRLSGLRLKSGKMVSVRVCRSANMPPRGHIWILQKENQMKCAATIFAGMNELNDRIEKLYVLPRIRNSSRIYLSTEGLWLKQAIPIRDLSELIGSLDSLADSASVQFPLYLR